MKENDYYHEIKNLIENYEINHRVRTLQDNSEKLQMNWDIGRLLVEAQGGSKRAKYGDGLIKQWSIAFMRDYGKHYNVRELKKNETILFALSKMVLIADRFELDALSNTFFY